MPEAPNGRWTFSRALPRRKVFSCLQIEAQWKEVKRGIRQGDKPQSRPQMAQIQTQDHHPQITQMGRLVNEAARRCDETPVVLTPGALRETRFPWSPVTRSLSRGRYESPLLTRFPIADFPFPISAGSGRSRETKKQATDFTDSSNTMKRRWCSPPAPFGKPDFLGHLSPAPCHAIVMKLFA